MLKANLHTLSSGLRVVLAPIADSPTATVEVRVETGSKYESVKEAGLSHFLEHMCFKGTEKRPSSLEVTRALDELGAVSNAFTSTEVTGYWAKSGYEDLPAVLDIIADIYLHAVFRKEDVEKERGVIIEEIHMYEDQPQAVVAELFEATMHGDQPAGRPVIGTPETVRSFTAEDFYAYRAKHYVAAATVITVAGRFDERDILRQIETAFADVSTGPKTAKVWTESFERGVSVALKKKEIDQAHLILGMRSFPYGDPRNTAVSVMRAVLSGGLSSRLWHKMREELGICYYISAGNGPSTDHGEFAVSSGVDPARAAEAVSAICGELRRIAAEPVSEVELNKVKRGLVSRMYMGLESSDAVADWFSDRQVFSKDLRSPFEREQDLRNVSAEQVQAVARDIFTEKDVVLAVVGRDPDPVALQAAVRL